MKLLVRYYYYDDVIEDECNEYNLKDLVDQLLRYHMKFEIFDENGNKLKWRLLK